MASADPAVAVNGLSLAYPGKTRGAALSVLEDLSFEVRRGEFLCIVGPSGCGKSTLLNVVSGFLRPTQGSVLVDGEPVRGPDRRRIFVFQENGVFPWLTVEKNVGFGLSRLAPEERRQRVDHYVEMVGLVGFEHAYPYQLSGGMRQRVEIARALAASPDVLYMDEPFGALDFLTRLKMRSDLIRIWQRERKTVLFVTHDIEEAVQLADRVIVMTARPARIAEVVPVELPRPRDLDAPAYLETRNRIFAAMGMRPSGEVEVAAPWQGGRLESRPTRSEPQASEGGPLHGLATARAPSRGSDAEVIVLGGGPAGTILGAYLARAGIDHCILEKAVHPRPHVGESLLCSTTRVFREIEFLDVLEREGFLRKPGALWTHFAEEREVELRFRSIPSLGVEQDWTWHIDRSRFDQLLLEHAAALGSRVLEDARVERVEFDGDGTARGVRLQTAAGPRALRAHVVVDATGRATLLGSQLRLKRPDPEFHQFSVHGWFEGVDRGPVATASHIHLHVLPGPRSWAWQIPISASVTSVGVVTDGARFVKAGESAERFFAERVAGSHWLAERMRDARPLHALQREGNYSYTMDSLAGDGWLLVGDAARFVDPLFSSGLSVAAESARAAAEAIAAALRANDVSAARFADYAQRIRSGVDIWREFIHLYYRLPRVFLGLLGDAETRPLLQDVLQGVVYDGGASPALDALRRGLAAVEADPAHPWHAELELESH